MSKYVVTLSVTVEDAARVPVEQQPTYVRETLTNALSKIPARCRLSATVDSVEVDDIVDVDFNE